MDNITYNYREIKIVAVISENISVQVALNLIGHLSISIGAYAPKSMMGRTYLVDKSGTKHLGISKYPYIITRANPRKIRKAICEARTSEDVFLQIFQSKCWLRDTTMSWIWLYRIAPRNIWNILVQCFTVPAMP